MSEVAPTFDDYDRRRRLSWWAGRIVVYGLLITWAAICLFPIFWTVTTSFKLAPDVMRGNLIPWLDFVPRDKGWESLGLSPDTIFNVSTVRDEFVRRFLNSVVISVSASLLAVALGSLAAYGLSRFSYRFGFMRNSDISFFFLSQLILPPVVLALPMLIDDQQVLTEVAVRRTSNWIESGRSNSFAGRARSWFRAAVAAYPASPTRISSPPFPCCACQSSPAVVMV